MHGHVPVSYACAFLLFIALLGLALPVIQQPVGDFFIRGPSTQVIPASPSFCGNEVCENNENPLTCPQDCPDPDLVFHGRFDDSLGDQLAQDSSSFANHLSCTSCPTEVTTSLGLGYSFSGSEWLLRQDPALTGSVPSSSSNPATAFTLAAWIDLDSLNDRQPILIKQTAPERGFVFMVGSDEFLEFEWWESPTNEHTITSLVPLVIGQPIHVAVTFSPANGGTVKLFIDGEENTMATGVGGPPQPNGADLDIGRYYWSSSYSRYFSGTIDEVHVYSRSLSSEELVLLADVPMCGDGMTQPPEECDDGDTVSGDGCSSTCQIEFCGDGILQPGLGEVCELGQTQPCSSGGYAGVQICLSDCSGFNTCQTGFCGDLVCETPPEDEASCPGDCFCGDGVCGPTECDVGEGCGNECAVDCTFTTNQIDQYGVTFFFDKPYPAGQFVNGDWWVMPNPGDTEVILTGITPAYSSGRNGWMVNPTSTNKQAYDDRMWGSSFDANLLPSPSDPLPTNPYAAQPGSSIIKSISVADPPPPEVEHLGSCRPCLDTAVVLTIVESPPPANAFRPPYFGTEKPLYLADTLNTALLPSLTPTPDIAAEMPTLTDLADRWMRVQLDHIDFGGGEASRYMHPFQNMYHFEGTKVPSEYSADMSTDAGIAGLRLMMDEPLSEKMPLLIGYVQAGIDWYHVGQSISWFASAGQHAGRAEPTLFAAALLDDSAMQSFITNASPSQWQEREQLFYTPDGLAKWGDGGFCNPAPGLEDHYWEDVVTGGLGKRTCRDPYGQIDGGWDPGGTTSKDYQYCCSSKTYLGMALALELVPELRAIWNLDAIIDYVERWETQGVFTQPDTCAPYTDVVPGPWPHPDYGITFGPDGSGGCIQDTNLTDGTGRFPDAHGAFAGGGSYGNSYVNEMYQEYS